jgi:NAD(P)-dependent dehydrogenase (short-subunit alcohol dehydrogenase family)
MGERFKNKIVVIVGGNSGIGFAVAKCGRWLRQ